MLARTGGPVRGALGRRHVRVWLAAVVSATVVGTGGYMLLLGWPFWDALYMTVISLTTVGFRESGPRRDWPHLDDAGDRRRRRDHLRRRWDHGRDPVQRCQLGRA